MPVSLTATLGSPTANSYVTLARAVEVIEDLLLPRTAWNEADADTRSRALLMACLGIERFAQWRGWRLTNEQRLGFPMGAYGDSLGRIVTTGVLPLEIEQAQVAYAVLILEAFVAGSGPGTPEEQAVRRLKAGPMEIEFEPRSKPAAVLEGLPAVVRDLLALHVAGIISGGHITVALERG